MKIRTKVLSVAILAVLFCALIVGNASADRAYQTENALATLKAFSEAATKKFAADKHYWKQGETSFRPQYTLLDLRHGFLFKYFSNSEEDGNATKFVMVAFPATLSQGKKIFVLEETTQIWQCRALSHAQLEELYIRKISDVNWSAEHKCRLTTPLNAFAPMPMEEKTKAHRNASYAKAQVQYVASIILRGNTKFPEVTSEDVSLEHGYLLKPFTNDFIDDDKATGDKFVVITFPSSLDEGKTSFFVTEKLELFSANVSTEAQLEFLKGLLSKDVIWDNTGFDGKPSRCDYDAITFKFEQVIELSKDAPKYEYSPREKVISQLYGLRNASMRLKKDGKAYWASIDSVPAEIFKHRETFEGYKYVYLSNDTTADGKNSATCFIYVAAPVVVSEEGGTVYFLDETGTIWTCTIQSTPQAIAFHNLNQKLIDWSKTKYRIKFEGFNYVDSML